MSTTQPITLAPDGTPFKNEEAAKKFIKDKELDPNIHIATQENGGWCVFDTSGLPSGVIATMKQKPQPATGKAKKQKYFKVMFQAKTNVNDEDYVRLSLNGDLLFLQRETEVILPESYLEVADHAVHTRTITKPGQSRKTPTKVRKYSYSRIAEVSEKEFNEYLEAGNKKRDEDLKQAQV